jgi:MFS family permease
MKVSSLVLRVTIAAGLASISANAMRVFFVESAVDRGEELSIAGFILGGASAVAILARLVGGWRSDFSSRNPFRSAGLLMIVGAVGYAMMSFVDGTFWLAVAAVLGIAAGWGWSGLIQLGLVRASTSDSHGAESAFVHFGMLVGSLIGPILYGLLVTIQAYFWAWITIAIIGAVGAAVLMFGRGTERGSLQGVREPEPV